MSGVGDIKDDVVIIFKERIAGPIGYVIFSFVAYNWSWFYFLFFSKKTAEDKISIIKHDFNLLHGTMWPLAFGVLLAISTPFIKVLMTHITAIARQLEDKKNYQIKSFLDKYIEETKLDLIKKKQEITEREANIKDLMGRKLNLDKDIKDANDTIEGLRKEDSETRKNINNIKRETHSLQNMLAEYRVTYEGFEELREKLYNKSSAHMQLKNQLISIKNTIDYVQTYLSGDQGFFAMLSQDQVHNFNSTLKQIQESIKSIDDGTFEIIKFSTDYDGPGGEVNISTLKFGINWGDFVNLLEKNNLPTGGFLHKPDSSVSIRFTRALTDEETNKVTSLYKEYLENN
ncbi:hypothetical protein JY535_01775 [Serratia marcescens]|nr:hypothetical protein [Serratia marcescens]MBN5257400.1 hypothetical protein [Serratia marcescens]MBN5352620.1 hypothetical protein [Serratia marcescens]HEJ8040546.1 hypothetical protein [Serratia marcescens]HEJ8045270.1 hypothetical protein [Serratia marcescens]